MIYSFELNEKETEKVETFAKEVGQSVSELAKVCLLDEIDLAREAEEARAEFEADTVIYTLDEVERELLKKE